VVCDRIHNKDSWRRKCRIIDDSYSCSTPSPVGHVFFILKQNSTESSNNAPSSNSDRLEFVPSYKSETSVPQKNTQSTTSTHKQVDIMELEKTTSPKRNADKDTETSIIQVAAEFKKSASESLDSLSKSQEGSGGMVSPLRKRPSRSIQSPNRFSPSGKLVNTEMVLGLRRSSSGSSSGIKKEKESQESAQREEVEPRSSSPTKTRSKSLRSSRSRV